VGIRVCETLKPSVEVRDVVVAVELFDKLEKCPSAKLPGGRSHTHTTLPPQLS
jgi:hypothetical protein